jgi:TPR repeat protein
MNRWIVHCLRTLVIIVLVGVMWAGLIVLHFTLWNRGGIAVKTGNGALALKYLKPLAWLGDEHAQYVIGEFYAYGIEGIQKNDEEAIYWFHRIGFFGGSSLVVEQGVDRAAAYELLVASTYACGGDSMVKVADPVESLKWLKRAATDGSKKAATILGEIERSGLQRIDLCPRLLSETGSMGPVH